MLCSHNIWDVDVAIRHFEIPQEYSYYSCMPTDPKSKTECRSSAMELRHRPLPRQTGLLFAAIRLQPALLCTHTPSAACCSPFHATALTSAGASSPTCVEWLLACAASSFWRSARGHGSSRTSSTHSRWRTSSAWAEARRAPIHVGATGFAMSSSKIEQRLIPLLRRMRSTGRRVPSRWARLGPRPVCPSALPQHTAQHELCAIMRSARRPLALGSRSIARALMPPPARCGVGPQRKAVLVASSTPRVAQER
jgi:hypothetical protein